MQRSVAAMFIVAATWGVGCDGRAPIESCQVNLHGVYVTPAGARWMLLDHGATLEVIPLFDDSVAEGAPRLIDLSRTAAKLTGHLKRRYMRRAVACEARAPATITTCKDDTLQLVLGDVTPPLTYEPCTFGPPLPSRVEAWRRE